MLIKLSTDKTVSETAAALQAAVQANHLASCRCTQPQRDDGEEGR